MKKKTADAAPRVPPAHDWRTTDEDEVARRRLRAQSEGFDIANRAPTHPIFSNFDVRSPSGMTYSVEIRDLANRQYSCDCPDFRKNGLGTCKHVEGTLDQLRARKPGGWRKAEQDGSERADIAPDPETGGLRIERGLSRLPASLRRWFDAEGRLPAESVSEFLAAVGRTRCSALRVSQDVAPFLEQRRYLEERLRLRREYEARVRSGEWPPHETLVPLFPYQREGMLHLAFTERALLADEMGLGKTIQAIAACALLHRLGRAERVLVVTPASLKTEWEEQIRAFTTLPYRLIFGGRAQRLADYRADGAPFFTVVNYEQMIRDAGDVNRLLRPDAVVLDEAQRIKNWNTKTAQAVKRLQSRYAFVLTGTPIENRIDELYSIVDFLNPSLLGPLFRFNRDYYDLDERGKPRGYRNLDGLHRRIRPILLRRRKDDVETELPPRVEKTFFVSLTPEQRVRYEEHEAQVARLAGLARRRPLIPREQDKLMRELAMMRMVCDTNYILDPDDRACPKLGELEKVLDECRENGDVKVIVFSEWARMLELVRELCERMGLGFAWHTGTVPQRRRREEINRFKGEPACRVFISTDSGSTGLNLQNASVVINCDLPWNPARLEQRIARAWRKNQTRPVTVVNLVADDTIERRMLGTLAAKQALADGVLDLRGDLGALKMPGGRQAFLDKLESLMTPGGAASSGCAPGVAADFGPGADRGRAFADRAATLLRGAAVRCEERYPLDGLRSVMVVVVDRDAAAWRERLDALHGECFGREAGDAAPRLEVLDRATDEAIARLVEAGLLRNVARAARTLHPAADAGGVPELTPEERARVAEHAANAERKTRMARALLAADLGAEAREAALAAGLARARALAARQRLPEPTDVEQALLPPVGLLLGAALAELAACAADANRELGPMLDALDRVAQPL